MSNEADNSYIKVEGTVIEPADTVNIKKDLFSNLVIEDTVIDPKDLENLSFTQKMATMKYKKTERDTLTKLKSKPLF